MRSLWGDGSASYMWGAAADRALRTKGMLYPGLQGAPTGAQITLCVLSVHGMRSLRCVCYVLCASSQHVLD